MAESDSYQDSIGMFAAFFLVAVIFYVFWIYFDDEIRNLIRWVRYAQMWVISWFIDNSYTVDVNNQRINWQSGFRGVANLRYGQINDLHLVYINALTVQPLKFFYCALMAGGGLWAIFKGPGTHFTTKYDLSGLIKRQSQNFPTIAPFVDFNPSDLPPRSPGDDVPAELPLFAEALGPEEWIVYNQIPVPDGRLSRAATLQALRKQIGRPYRGWKKMNAHKQVLLAAFCLKAARKREQADAFLGEIALCWSAKSGLKLKSSVVGKARKILRDRSLSQNTLKVMKKHAFESTALLRALDYARSEGGVLAPALFVWLRGHDRTLWYPLNNLGRQSLNMESLGVMSHYKMEKIANRPVPVPKIEDAFQALRQYVSSDKMRPLPKLQYKGTKKRAIKKAV